MKKEIIPHNQCHHRQIHFGLLGRLIQNVAAGLDEHIQNCPRCQRRLGLLNRVETAILLLRSEVHSCNLLASANAEALKHLAHDMRFTPQADNLRTVAPKPNWLELKRPILEKTAAIVACAAVMILFKTGLFSSIEKFQEEGQDAMHHYFTSRLDENMADELIGPRQELESPENRHTI